MCILIDACVRDRVFADAPDVDAKPVFDWIATGGGAMVIGGQLYDELSGSRRARAQVEQWRRTGKAVVADRHRLCQCQAAVAQANLQSNDGHIIALAQASGARRLFTADGLGKGALMADFGDKTLIDRPRGKVYQRAEHVHLLVHTRGCPKW